MELNFTEKTLLDYDSLSIHFEKLNIGFFIASNLLYPERMGENIGVSDYGAIITAIEQYNYSFHLLCKNDLDAEAAAFIRIQVDNLIYLYAEYLYPHRVLRKVYDKGKELCNVLIANKPIKRNEILQKLEERFTGVKLIWDRYCNFIHPTNSYIKLKFNDAIKSPTIADLVYLNQVITTVLLESLKYYEDELKGKGLFEEYERLCKEELNKFCYYLQIDKASLTE